MKNDKGFTEPMSDGKYNKVELEGKAPAERPNLPFQAVEAVNEPRLIMERLSQSEIEFITQRLKEGKPLLDNYRYINKARKLEY